MRSYDVQVLVGTYLLNSGGERRRVRKIIAHEKFDGRYSFSYDIALIRLEAPLQFNDQVKPIKYSDKVIEGNVNDLLITGYGKLHNDDDDQSNSMQEIFVKSISNEECLSKSSEDVHSSHLCTVSQFGEGICDVSLKLDFTEQTIFQFLYASQGDSGNPLVLNRDLLVGIASLSAP